MNVHEAIEVADDRKANGIFFDISDDAAIALAAEVRRLRAENADLIRRLHQLDSRREAAQNVARSLAEYGHDYSYPVERHPGSMDPTCSTIGIDSEGGSMD